MATPLYFPNAARALPRPRVYAPQSNTGTAAMAGGLSALSQVAEIWRDKKNFEQQAEQMAQTLEREGMTEQASLYRNAAQNAATNFFSDPATNRKAQQGLLSDALKLLQQKQENDLRREIAQSQIDAQIASDTRRDTSYTERQRAENAAAARGYNAGVREYNKRNPNSPLAEISEDGSVVPPPSPILSDITTSNDPLRQQQIDINRDELNRRKEKDEETKRIRAQFEAKGKEYDALGKREEEKGFTVQYHQDDGVTTGYTVKDMRGRVLRRVGVQIIRDASGLPLLRTESDTTTTTVPQGSTGIAPESPATPYMPGAIMPESSDIPGPSSNGLLPDPGLQ